MVETAGTKLRRMRILRQLSLEDVARGTRIGAARLADLEADEYSNFPSVAYAKGFLRSYAKFLDVDLKTYLEGFENGASFGLDDYQYLSEKPVCVYRVQRRPQQRPRFERKRLFATVSLLGMLAIAGFFWFLYLTAQRLGDLNKLAERQEARAHGVSRPGAEPPPEATPTSSDSMGRELVVQTLAESSPSAVLSQLAVPAANVPVLSSTPGSDGAVGGSTVLRAMIQKPLLPGGPASSPGNLSDGSAGQPAAAGTNGNRFLVHMLDKSPVDVFRTGVPRPAKPAGNTLE